MHRQNVGSNQTPWFSKHPEDEPEQKLRVSPLRKGLTFHFHLDFENLALREFSLLVYALRPIRFPSQDRPRQATGSRCDRYQPIGIFYIDRASYSIATLGSTAALSRRMCDHPGQFLAALYPREYRE